MRVAFICSDFLEPEKKAEIRSGQKVQRPGFDGSAKSGMARQDEEAGSATLKQDQNCRLKVSIKASSASGSRTSTPAERADMINCLAGSQMLGSCELATNS